MISVMNAAERGIAMNLFDILGPVMVGPSSSHTAGAVRIGRMARRLLGEGTPFGQAMSEKMSGQ